MTNDIEKLRKKIKSINTDEEIDEIHEILDRLDGSYFTRDARVAGVAKKIVEEGHAQEINITNEFDQHRSITGKSALVSRGIVRADITFIASAEDVYDD